MITFVGKQGVDLYRAAALKAGLGMYSKCGMQPNRMWTPRRMMALATELTGRKFKARDYDGAIVALTALIAETPKEGIVISD